MGMVFSEESYSFMELAQGIQQLGTNVYEPIKLHKVI
jgi:hypothetical protein